MPVNEGNMLCSIAIILIILYARVHELPSVDLWHIGWNVTCACGRSKLIITNPASVSLSLSLSRSLVLSLTHTLNGVVIIFGYEFHISKQFYSIGCCIIEVLPVQGEVPIAYKICMITLYLQELLSGRQLLIAESPL